MISNPDTDTNNIYLYFTGSHYNKAILESIPTYTEILEGGSSTSIDYYTKYLYYKK
jgi:hypothetical protein